MKKEIEFMDGKITFLAEYVDDYTAQKGDPNHGGYYFSVSAPAWISSADTSPGLSQVGAFLREHCSKMFSDEDKARQEIISYLQSHKKILETRKKRIEIGFSLSAERIKKAEREYPNCTFNEDGTFSVFTDNEEIIFGFQDKYALKPEDIKIVELRREKLSSQDIIVCPICGASTDDIIKQMTIKMFGNCGCRKE